MIKHLNQSEVEDQTEIGPIRHPVKLLGILGIPTHLDKIFRIRDVILDESEDRLRNSKILLNTNDDHFVSKEEMKNKNFNDFTTSREKKIYIYQ